jgi:hypothetical protein
MVMRIVRPRHHDITAVAELHRYCIGGSILWHRDRIRIRCEELPNLRICEHRRPERLPPCNRAIVDAILACGNFLQNGIVD